LRTVLLRQLARFRVPLGFASAAVAFALAQPSMWSWWSGFAVAIAGEALRVWAAGHLAKGREITTSGPYRFVRHPLYAGSSLLAAGCVIAAQQVWVAVLAFVYLSATLTAAVRTEEAVLDEKFDGAYTHYRSGAVLPDRRRFTWRRVSENREYRAVAGLLAAFAFLFWRIRE
jgi:protein-S-isoprenylcysteine O-methyltransferase Ste14